MDKKLFIIACVCGLLAVVLGAFAAHGLKDLVSQKYVDIFHTGVEYQFYHTFALLATALAAPHLNKKLLRRAGYMFLTGICLFSGSLYILAFREAIQVPTMIVGPLTPIGGVFFIIGWAMLLVAAWSKNK